MKIRSLFMMCCAVGSLALVTGCGNKKAKFEQYSVQELSAKMADVPECPLSCKCVQALSDEQYSDSIKFVYHSYTSNQAEIRAWYLGEMERLGWSKEFDWQLHGVHICFKKGKKYCLIRIKEQHKKQIIMLQIGRKA